MIYSLALPSINDQMTLATIVSIAAPVGAEVPVGGKVLEVRLSVGPTHPQDCPPVSHYSLNTRDRVWVRRWTVAEGDEPAVGAPLALFSTEPDEPVDVPPHRELRLTIAGIVPDMISWGDWK